MKYLKVWTSFREVIRTLKDDEKGRLFDMMLAYAETGEEPVDFIGNEAFLFPVGKQMIDLAAEKAEKLAQNGANGGKANASKLKQTEATESNCEQAEANASILKLTEAEKKRKEKKCNEKKGNESGNNMGRFTPPSVSEVEAYCEERGVFLINAESFVDYYAARGWVLTNGKKMVDWKAAVRLWESKERQRKTADDGLPY